MSELSINQVRRRLLWAPLFDVHRAGRPTDISGCRRVLAANYTNRQVEKYAERQAKHAGSRDIVAVNWYKVDLLHIPLK